MFRTSTPVTGAAFHNRQTEIEQLLEVFGRLEAGAPEWLAIVGVSGPVAGIARLHRFAGGVARGAAGDSRRRD